MAGELVLDLGTVTVDANPAHTLTVYHARPGTPTADALAHLSDRLVLGTG